MTGLYTLAAMGLVCLVAAVVVYAALRASSRAGAAEAEVDATARQMEARKADQERADEIERRADLARRAMVRDNEKLAGHGDALALRLRASGRGRKTGG